MADEDHIATLAGVASDLHVHLGHQGTGGVEHLEISPLRLILDGLGDAVRREDDGGAIGHLVELADEHGAHRPQPLDDMAVVDHLMAHEDRCTVELDRPLDDVDGAVDAGAEAARIGEP